MNREFSQFFGSIMCRFCLLNSELVVSEFVIGYAEQDNIWARGIIKFQDHSGLWPKVSLVFEDFKFKIWEGKEQN